MPKTTAPEPVVPTDTPEQIAKAIARNTIDMRITELKIERNAGQKMLADLAAKEDELKTTLLRISGAIQVLEELLAK